MTTTKTTNTCKSIFRLSYTNFISYTPCIQYTHTHTWHDAFNPCRRWVMSSIINFFELFIMKTCIPWFNYMPYVIRVTWCLFFFSYKSIVFPFLITKIFMLWYDTTHEIWDEYSYEVLRRHVKKQVISIEKLQILFIRSKKYHQV